jgi:DNA-binding beta-propeller fold protein YncE
MYLLLLVAVGCTQAQPYYKLDSAYPTGLSSLNISQLTAVALVSTPSGALELHVAQRGLVEPPFLVLDTDTGALLRKYGVFEKTLKSPHGMASSYGVVQGPSSLWVADIVNSTVLQLDPATGAVLTLIGSKGLGTAPPQFSSPADLALDASGALLVSDGDGGVANRVLKLPSPVSSPSAPAAFAIGHCNNPAANSSLGCFDSPHSIAYAPPYDHVWVADRGNNRLQVLAGATGAVVGVWSAEQGCFGTPGAQPWGVRYDGARNRLLVADGGPAGNPSGGEPGAVYALQINTGPGWSRDSIGPCTGTLLQTLSVPNEATAKPHELAVDEVSGDVYLADIGVPPAVVRWRAV